MPIRVNIAIPEEFQARARYVFTLLSHHWGIPLRFVAKTESFDLRYSLEQYSTEECDERDGIYLRCDPSVYDGETNLELQRVANRTLLIQEGRSPLDSDIIGAIYRLANFVDEEAIPESLRDKRGIFTTEALPSYRQRSTDLAFIDEHALYLLDRVLAYKPSFSHEVLPRWPGGKMAAISLTHDTDSANIGSIGEIGVNLAKAIVRRSGESYAMFQEGLSWFGRDATRNPLFGFPRWQELESSLNLRSCFYLFVRPEGTRRALNDCKSSVTDKVFSNAWEMFKRLADQGWEFGLHPSIHCKDDIESFLKGKRLIEEKLRQPIYGLRHHYWALDWRKPYRTFRKHVNAGFRYDTSIAFRDVPGFRAGTSLPFKPFDPVRQKTLDIYELPTCLMDKHVISSERGLSEIKESATKMIEYVKKIGGMAVLDWHTETACNRFSYQHYVDVLSHILEPLSQNSDIWFATPHEISQHWHQRSQLLGGWT